MAKRPPVRHLLFLLQQGYGLISLPMSLIGFATTIYYLAIKNIPSLQVVFPGFMEFLVIGGLAGLPVMIILGYAYSHSGWYTAGMENSAEVNPYSTRKFSANSVPFHALMLRLMLREPGFPADLVEAQRRMLEDSK